MQSAAFCVGIMSADPLRPHSHDNNIQPPSADTHIVLTTPAVTRTLTVADLQTLPQTNITYSYTTDHGPHGPYHLQGVSLRDLLAAYGECDRCDVSHFEIISADGFGNRIEAAELDPAAPHDPVLLCLSADGRPLTLANGLVRLVVPSETDNALRQIKWVRQINLIAHKI